MELCNWAYRSHRIAWVRALNLPEEDSHLEAGLAVAPRSSPWLVSRRQGRGRTQRDVLVPLPIG